MLRLLATHTIGERQNKTKVDNLCLYFQNLNLETQTRTHQVFYWLRGETRDKMPRKGGGGGENYFLVFVCKIVTILVLFHTIDKDSCSFTLTAFIMYVGAERIRL